MEQAFGLASGAPSVTEGKEGKEGKEGQSNREDHVLFVPFVTFCERPIMKTELPLSGPLRQHLPLLVCLAILSPPAHAATTIEFSMPYYFVSLSAGYSNAGSQAVAVEGFPDVTAVFVERSGDLGGTVAVDLATAADTALPGVDYTETVTNLVFQPGETGKAVLIPIVNDQVAEPFETFWVNLSNPTGGAVLGRRKTITVRITDNDQGIQFELPDYTVNEDAGTVTLRVLRPDEAASSCAVDFMTVDGTAVAGVDYVAIRGTLEFATGTPLKYVVVSLLNDAVRRANREFQVRLGNFTGAGELGSQALATVTILDTDEVVQFASTNVTVLEDAALIRLIVTRGESTSAGSVEVVTANRGARVGVDYVGVTNTLAFAAGERLRRVEIPLLNDGLREATKGFQVLLRNPTGAVTLGRDCVATVAILDNDPGLGFATNSYQAWEKFHAVEVQVVRGSDAWLGSFAVDYETYDSSARAGTDYQAASGTLSFEPGERVKALPLTLLRNPVGSATKTFGVRLRHPSGPLPIVRSLTSITITDESQGRTVWVRPPVRGEAGLVEGRVELSWPGAAAVWRADAITGPWEELGTVDSPFVLGAGPAAAGFYQLRSPRAARVYLPSGYDKATPMPLVLVLHGAGDTTYIVDYFGMEPLAEVRGFLLSHPAGTTDSEGYIGWNATEEGCVKGADDAAYLRGLIEALAGQYAVDPKRIHLAGHSCGGAMSQRMACDHADLIAGIACYAGYMELDPELRRPSEPVNVLVLHGTADDIVAYGGGVGGKGDVWGARGLAVARNWAAYNGGAGAVWDTQPVLDLDLTLPGLDSTVLRYTTCPPGGAVELWTINGGTHIAWLYDETRRSQFQYGLIDWLLAHPKP